MQGETPKIKDQVVILQGNEACALAALDADCRFFAGYPITPSTEIIEYMALEMPKRGGVFIQMEDEIASACSIVGARWGGVKAMTATSGPGFSLKQEAIGFAACTETPVVIVNVQRGGPSTGQPTLSSQQDIYQARYGSHGDYEMIAFAPSSVQEMYDHTIRAFEIAERFRTPVVILADEIIGHMREKLTVAARADETDGAIHADQDSGEAVQVDETDGAILADQDNGEAVRADEDAYKATRADEDANESPRTDQESDGVPCYSPSADFFTGNNVLVEGQLHDKLGRRIGHIAQSSGEFIENINHKISDRIDQIADVDFFFIDDAEIIFICYGSVARAAMNAVVMARGIRDPRQSRLGNFLQSMFFGDQRPIRKYRGLKVGMIKINTVWPFPEDMIQKLTIKADAVVVPEMNIGKYVREVERALPDKLVFSHPKCGGELHTPNELLDHLFEITGVGKDAIRKLDEEIEDMESEDE